MTLINKRFWFSGRPSNRSMSRSGLLAALAACGGCAHYEAPLPSARNIIFMVPDGMGLADATAARIFKNGPGGEPLAFETLPQIGYQRTWSASSTITDSAAAASVITSYSIHYTKLYDPLAFAGGQARCVSH